MDTLQSLTDERLVEKYVQGCNEAFEVLLYRHKDRLFNYIFGVTHDRDLTEDIFQDTFVKAIVSLRQGRYSDSGKFYSWLSRIAHNLIIDHYRHAENEGCSSVDEGDVLNNAALYDDSFDSRTYERMLVRLVQLVDLLPDNQQRIVRLRLFDDLSFKEIAEREGISINTALGRMRYAILNLRRITNERHFVADFERAVG